jgi:hypothetical protein
VGLLMMCMPFLYSLRKKSPRMASFGSLRLWLEAHIFCGIVGPALVVFHTSLKFNGVVSVAFWAMLMVAASGFVGRYLYVRIPRSIRGSEMGYDEILALAAKLRGELAAASLPTALLDRVEALECAVASRPEHVSIRRILFNRIAFRRRLARLRREMREAGVDVQLIHEVVRIEEARLLLLGRLAYLHRTKKLFELWHLFHQPLVYLMLAVVVLHMCAALYLGYVPF